MNLLDQKSKEFYETAMYAAVVVTTKFVQERVRQQEQENWTLEDDDRSTLGQLASAAACYAADPASTIRIERTPEPPRIWPFTKLWWKPMPVPTSSESFYDGRLRELQKAGALLIAEYQRIERLKAKGGEQ